MLLKNDLEIVAWFYSDQKLSLHIITDTLFEVCL